MHDDKIQNHFSARDKELADELDAIARQMEISGEASVIRLNELLRRAATRIRVLVVEKKSMRYALSQKFTKCRQEQKSCGEI